MREKKHEERNTSKQHPDKLPCETISKYCVDHHHRWRFQPECVDVQTQNIYSHLKTIRWFLDSR